MPFWRGMFAFGVIIQALCGFWMLVAVYYSGRHLSKLHPLPTGHDTKYFKLGQYLLCVCGSVSILVNWLPVLASCVLRYHEPLNLAVTRNKNLLVQVWLAACLLLTVGECIGIRYQITVLPSRCEDAESSRLLRDIGSIRFPEQMHPAISACQRLTSFWHWTLPILIIYGLVITSGVLSFFETFPQGQWPNWKPNININLPPWLQATFRSVGTPIRFVWRCWCRSWPLAIALSIFTVLLPFILPVVWIGELFKHFNKDSKPGDKKEGWQYQFDIDLEVFNAPVTDTPGSSPFEKVLGIDDLFFSICEFSHGRDIHTLAAVSKTTNAVIKSHWKQNRKSMIKAICDNSGKSCYYCSIQCCDECKGLAYTIQTSIREMQRRTLQVMCSRCYMSELFAPNHFTSLALKCPGNHQQNIFTDEDHNRWIWICRNCSQGVKGIKTAEEMRERHAKITGLQLNSFSHHNCFACDRKIWKTSLRWWRCTECGLECRDKQLGVLNSP